MLCTRAEAERAIADPWCWRLWLVWRCSLTEGGTSTPETCLGFCLSCVLRNAATVYSFYAKTLLLHGELFSWHYVLMEKLQNERSCFPAQDPGRCFLLGGLALFMLGHRSSLADSKTPNKTISISLISSHHLSLAFPVSFQHTGTALPCVVGFLETNGCCKAHWWCQKQVGKSI